MTRELGQVNSQIVWEFVSGNRSLATNQLGRGTAEVGGELLNNEETS